MSTANIESDLRELASVDLFREGRDGDTFIGRPFYFDYTRVKLLVNDKWKAQVGGVPAGSFLLCSYDGEPDVAEMVLVRVLGPTALPTDSDVVASMVDYYKEEVPLPGAQGVRLDTFTRYEFMFSGLECRVLGSFYRNDRGELRFSADVETFFSPHNYSAFKPRGRVLEYIVNFREDGGIPGGRDQVRLGEVRYSAARHRDRGPAAPIFVSALDFVGQRTALFGMTRTGKSNTVKKIIESTIALTEAEAQLRGVPLAPVGQIIFDVNGEYANPNQQDEGTAIFQLFTDRTVRYSLLPKEGFEVMKLNFHGSVQEGFGLLQSFLASDAANYVRSFLSINLEEPPRDDRSAYTRWQRLIAAYRACLYRAGFDMGPLPIRFPGKQEINEQIAGGRNPSQGLSGDDAVTWFEAVWDSYNEHEFFKEYQKKNGREWADEDLKAVMAMLTRKTTSGGSANVSGFRKLQPFREYHSPSPAASFEGAIVERLRDGQIVIVDLSQGDPLIQSTYADRICRRLFSDAMDRFIANERANYIQIYFEEAHNLFPKRDDRDLQQIYNRLAKEGAKLRLGLIYATQEPSSISGNVLKNTQNWFVSHLNNREELREVEKYYDFEDFSDSLRQTDEQGFIRMKTASNAFTVPVQIDRFTTIRESS